MKILALEIYGFRGVSHGRLVFTDQVTFVGPNGAGKSTIVDALSLLFGRQKLVSDLTEHDFTGSRPKPRDRIRFVVTLGGFPTEDPQDYHQWFRSGRAVEKWWNPDKKTVESTKGPGTQLCVQIGYAARFDHEDLIVKHVRYFHQHDEQIDPFDEELIDRFPDRLLSEIGFFVLPARRTWAATISFGSELFRKAVATLGGVPANTVLRQLEALRHPTDPLENDKALQPLVDSINERMGQLLPGSFRLQLRLTGTDSDSFLRALVPHYAREGGEPLPIGRHGTGLVSLQALILLLEIGRARIGAGQSFILALEEPELHVPPGLQRRLIGDAAAIADQIVCTTHAPRVAAFFDARNIQILGRTKLEPTGYDGASEALEGRVLAPESMLGASNAITQLYTDHRAALVEALMFPRVLIPEGRVDYEWFRLMLDVAETGDRPLHKTRSDIAPFGSVAGVVPTRSAAVVDTYERLSVLHESVAVIVDGDSSGDGYISKLLKCPAPPACIFQWQDGWEIEDAIRWALEADPTPLLSEIQTRVGIAFQSLDDLITILKNPDGRSGGLKTHYLAHEEIAGAMRRSQPCVKRVEHLLEAVVRTLMGQTEGSPYLQLDSRSTSGTKIWRFRP